MDYKVYEYDNYNIHVLSTDKFKSTIVSLTLVNEFKKENLTKNALLRRLLTSSSGSLKNQTEVYKKSYELYNTDFSVINELYNNAILTIFDIEFLEDKYTEDGLQDKALSHYFDMIFNPNIINGKFEESNFKLAKKSLLNYYEMQKEDKYTYSINKSHELLEEEQLKYAANGYIEDLEKLNEKNMAEYYKELFETAHADIFIMGNINDDKIIDLVNENVKDKLYKNNNVYSCNIFDKTSDIKEALDKEENNQSKLVVLYKILNMTDRERNVVLPIFNRIFGLGNNSKLFRNVREKKSLAYDIRSIAQREESLITVISGISKESKNEVIDSINYELSKLQKGEFNDSDIDDAKKYRSIILKGFDDDNYSILGTKVSSVLFNNDDLEERRKNVDTVTKKEITDLANKLSLCIIYMLEGDKDNEED